MVGSFFKSKLFAVIAVLFFAAASSGSASAELRTLSLYFPHTKENLTVTYKKDGRYIPDAMRQLNWFFRDWRRDKATRMDPKTIDLLWELYADLGARKPAHIVSGYRSPATNGMLRRIGRKVARHSQHMRGKAIDVYFPDVPIAKMRGSALARRVGGVGYYPRSGRYGFIHIDSGTVRHWPRMSRARLAGVISRYRPTIGARHLRRNVPTTLVASARSGPRNIIPARVRGNRKIARKIVPLPRPRPLAVAMAAAAADTFIVPVSAPGGKQNFGPKPSLAGNSINSLLAASDLSGRNGSVQRTNRAAKSSFAGSIRSGSARNVPLLRPMQAAYGSNGFWWSGDMNGLIRRDGAPNSFSKGAVGNGVVLAGPEKLSTSDKSALDTMIAALTGRGKAVAVAPQVARSGKSDSLRVNRAAKGDLLIGRKTSAVRSPSQGVQGQLATDKLVGNFKAILSSADKPVGFGQ